MTWYTCTHPASICYPAITLVIYLFNTLYYDAISHIPCISLAVFGFLEGPETQVNEQGDVTLLNVGFIKGALFEDFLQMDTRGELRFTIMVTDGTAGE